MSNPSNGENLRGSAFMLAAMASFAMGDGFMKYAGADMPLSQILIVRGAMATFLLYGAIRLAGEITPWSSLLNPYLQVRIIAEIVATYSFFTALFNMPIADVSAVLQAVPLMVSLGAAYFFGETIGWRRITAIIVGLFGVLLIVKPGFAQFNSFSLLALLTVIAASTRDLATRRLPKDIPTSFVALTTVMIVSATAVLLAPFQTWRTLVPWDYTILACASFFLISGFFTIIAAMRVGEVGVVTPFRYFVLLFSALIGWWFFNEVPDNWTLLGSFIVVGMGVYTIYREHFARRPVASEIR